MAIDIDEYKKLKANAEAAQSEADRAAGRLEQAISRLEEEFGCKTIKAAAKLLSDLEAELAQAEKVYNDAKREFEEQWGEHIATISESD